MAYTLRATVFLFTLISLGAVAAETKVEVQKIEDNSFLLEEAYNQEAGVIQHIQTFQYMKEKNWVYTFTEEWPVPNETHQLSVTLPIKRLAGPGAASGLGDLLLNYRYQLFLERPLAQAPRFSLVLPTGSYTKGLGNGVLGYQVNLPLSVEMGKCFVTHWNLGATLTPDAKEPGGAKATTVSFNYGFSVIWLAKETLNLFVELAGTSDEVVSATGAKLRSDTFYVNPGVRFAINGANNFQIVPGISFPIGIGPSEKDYGVMGYFSVEHSIW